MLEPVWVTVCTGLTLEAPPIRTTGPIFTVQLFYFTLLCSATKLKIVFVIFERSDMTTNGGGWDMVLNLDTRSHSLCSIILLTLVLDILLTLVLDNRA